MGRYGAFRINGTVIAKVSVDADARGLVMESSHSTYPWNFKLANRDSVLLKRIFFSLPWRAFNLLLAPMPFVEPPAYTRERYEIREENGKIMVRRDCIWKELDLDGEKKYREEYELDCHSIEVFYLGLRVMQRYGMDEDDDVVALRANMLSLKKAVSCSKLNTRPLLSHLPFNF